MNIPITWMTFHAYGEEDNNRRRTMPLKPHPTDPDKLVFVRNEYNLPKEWVGLTDEEIVAVLANLQEMYNRPPTTDSRVIFARAIEAKLKEKNA